MNDQALAADATSLDWSLLQLFVVVCEAGSLGRAAQRLGPSQPTLSRRLVALEAALGQDLFERTPRGLSLTAAGRSLREPALTMQQQALRLRRAVQAQARTLTGTVRLTASESVSLHLLLPILRELRREHPQIQIELVASDAVEDLLQRRADIAIRMVRPTQGELIARRLADMPLGLYAHRDYVALRGRPSRSNMDAHEWIGMDRSDVMLRGFAAAGHPVERAFFGFRCDSSAVTWQAVCAGLGIGAGLQAVAAKSPGVVRVLEDVAIPPMATWLVVHRELRGTQRLRLVFDALARALKAS